MNRFVKACLTVSAVLAGIFLLWVALLVGWSWSSDVTDDAVLWGGYVYGQEYELELPVFLIPQGFLSLGHMAIVPEGIVKSCGGRFHSSPETLEQYLSDPEAAKTIVSDDFSYEIEVAGYLEPGTKITPYQLEKTTGWGAFFGSFTTLTLLGKVLDGKFAGEIVDMADVSVSYRLSNDDLFLHKPDKRVLNPHDNKMAAENESSGCS